jgi:sialate O-acetylesterase
MRRVVLAAALAALACLSARPARADVKPHALFTDGMVLQQGVKCPVWGTADSGEQVSIELIPAEGSAVKASVEAERNGKWRVELPPVKAGGPYTMKIFGKNKITLNEVYVGEVWIASGQSNMEMRLKDSATGADAIKNSKNPKIRLFHVPHKIAAEPQTDVDAKWQECNPDTVGDFSAVAYFFGRDLQKARDVPVGLIETNWGGTVAEAWTPKATLEANADLKGLIPAEIKIDDAKPNPNQGTVLYNGMIAPLLPYAVKGVIWYQGESNTGRAYQYRTLFPAMIGSWREAWKNPDMPFLFVQLAMYWNNKSDGVTYAELREAQLLTTQTLKNAGMAVISDVSDEKDIHPKKKEPVGARLALAALGIAYGEKVQYSGPTFDSLKTDGNKVILTFKNVGKGLDAKDGDLTGFTVASEDKTFYPAKAEIKGDTVIVSCDKVDKPVAVRYGWANYAVVNLSNKDGLPASPFRTDDFPLTTAPKPR